MALPTKKYKERLHPVRLQPFCVSESSRTKKRILLELSRCACALPWQPFDFCADIAAGAGFESYFAVYQLHIALTGQLEDYTMTVSKHKRISGILHNSLFTGNAAYRSAAGFDGGEYLQGGIGMKSKLKRILSFVLAAAMLLAAAPVLNLAPRAHAATHSQEFAPGLN